MRRDCAEAQRVVGVKARNRQEWARLENIIVCRYKRELITVSIDRRSTRLTYFYDRDRTIRLCMLEFACCAYTYFAANSRCQLSRIATKTSSTTRFRLYRFVIGREVYAIHSKSTRDAGSVLFLVRINKLDVYVLYKTASFCRI